MSFIVALFVITRFTKNWLLVENQHRTLLKTYEELSLTVLQIHFEPHFLFNTLNNLYALSLKNLDKTLDVIQKFKSVLRFSISDSQKPKVPVEDELEMINNFIAIEQIRYGPRLRVKFLVSGNCKGLQIAPFIFFTLVENCFKHGSSIDAGSPWINISLTCNEGKVCFETRNSVPKKIQPSASSEGKGLAGLRMRLLLIYPKKHSITMEQGAQEFDVKLELDLN